MSLFLTVSVLLCFCMLLHSYLSICWREQAVYTVLREAEDRSVAPIPFWEIPVWKDISPRQRKVSAALKLINEILDELIAICKVWLSMFFRANACSALCINLIHGHILYVTV